MDELLERACELLGKYDEEAVHAITTDHNVDITALASVIASGVTQGVDLLQFVNVAKSAMEVAFYLGYLAGKEEGNLKLWEDQL